MDDDDVVPALLGRDGRSGGSSSSSIGSGGQGGSGGKGGGQGAVGGSSLLASLKKRERERDFWIEILSQITKCRV